MNQHLLLDIEGTTCPVSFISKILFPFAKRELSSYLIRNEHNGNQSQTIQKAKKEWAEDQSVKSVQLKKQVDLQQISEMDALTQYLEHLIVIDKKSTALKDIQGEIWELGYSNGELKAELFPETVECLQQWHQQGITLSVYSSGSIHAQKLLYRYTSEGNVETLFSHWFDTHTGPKKAFQSYTTIATLINSAPENIWFISDNGEECDAARKAGMKTLFSLRDGNPDRDPRDHEVIQSLHEVVRYLAAKK